jgi:putative hydrolase of the HAD superfamily
VIIYKHLFFDLDRTLWDFDTNSAQTLKESLTHFELNTVVRDFDSFVTQFNLHNEFVWDMYRKKKMNKETVRVERFRLTLAPYEINDPELINALQEYYIKNTPLKRILLDDCTEVLEYLKDRYNLYIITNGFYENQIQKMKSGGIDHFFKKVFTSDILGHSKPDSRIFEEAIKSVNAKKSESLFIGDDPINDIEGPKNFGIDQVWLKTDGKELRVKSTFVIENLIELKSFL